MFSFPVFPIGFPTGSMAYFHWESNSTAVENPIVSCFHGRGAKAKCCGRTATPGGARRSVDGLCRGWRVGQLPVTVFQIRAERFFESVLDEVDTGARILLAAFDDGRLVGTVQIVTATPPNQPHRADVAKLLVSRSARLRGVGTRLMEQVEEAARLAGKTLLVLDTVTGGSAERMYTRLGWNRVGIIPRYALFPDGTWCDTTVFWKEIAPDTGE